MNYHENILSFLASKGLKFDEKHTYRAFNFRDFEAHFHFYCLKNNLDSKDVLELDNFLKDNLFDFKIDKNKTFVFHVDIYHENELAYDTLIFTELID